MPNALPGPDNIARFVLPNGIVLLVKENFDAQSVVLAGSLAGGATFEDPAKQGLAALTAEATTRGTTSRDYLTLHETLESAGMSLDVHAGRFMTSFDGKALAEDLPALVELAGDALRNPTFPAEHVELLKGEIITGLQYNQQDTRFMAGKTFRRLAYPSGHILHRDATGEIETVAALTPDDLHDYHARQYGPGKMIVVVVGAVKPDAVKAVIEDTLGDWQNPQQQTDFTQPDIPPLHDIQYEAVEIPGKTQSDIVLGIPGPSRTAEDYMAARMVNNVLGVFGMMGRLGANVREEKGLAYYCYSNVAGGASRGSWSVTAGVNPENVKLAVESIREEIERIIEEPVTEQDLADNKANLTGRLPLLLESNAGVASNLLAMERYELGLDYLINYSELVNSLTAKELQAAMRRYWRADAFCLAVAGPKLNGSIV